MRNGYGRSTDTTHAIRGVFTPLRLAVIGCGAVAELNHLPAASRCRDVEVTVLVDRNLQRARRLAEQFGVGEVMDDYRFIGGKADAAIIALPHALHARVAVDLMSQGMDVLVEKPMALTAADCDLMIAAAQEHGVKLAVGLMRRFLDSHRLVKNLIDNGALGTITSFDIREGHVFGWPAASDFFFRREAAGGGVLMDIGVHTLDSLLWWLGDYESVEYRDDCYGGVEANCRLDLKMRSGAEGTVEISRTRNLRNTAIIRGEKGWVEVDLEGNRLSFFPEGDDIGVSGTTVRQDPAAAGALPIPYRLFCDQLSDWVGAARNGHKPLVTGEEGRRSVALIEECYLRRHPLDLPWAPQVFLRTGDAALLKNKKVLVTGGTGFIGGRLIECLVRDCGADVRALVRNFTRASHIARFPIEMVPGDVTDYGAVLRAAEGCDVIFHCAKGKGGTPAQRRQVNVQGTEHVLRAARERGVGRVVHVSTLSVYGQTPDGRLDERAPRQRSDEVYADSKREAEDLVFEHARRHGLSVSVVQPTVVYGPGAPAWTCGPIQKLSRGKMILVDNGEGFCNAVYVDDVIQAMILAAVRKEAAGEAFLVSARRPVTWKDFFGSYEKMIGAAATVPMTAEEAGRYLKKSRKDQNPVRLALRVPGEIGTALTKHPGLIRDLISSPATACLTGRCRPFLPRSIRTRGEKLASGRRRPDPGDPVCRDLPVAPLSEKEIRYYQAKTEVSIDKAQQLLGYVPIFELAEGMDLTEGWLEFTGFRGHHERS